MPILILYASLDALISNPDLSFKMESIHFIKRNGDNPIPYFDLSLVADDKRQ